MHNTPALNERRDVKEKASTDKIFRMTAELLEELEPCGCGYRWRWYIEAEPTQLDIDLGFLLPNGKAQNLELDVVERPCPHRNGSVIQYCPNCDTRLGMWGMGPAGSMECSCWDYGVPWYYHALNFIPNMIYACNQSLNARIRSAVRSLTRKR